RALHVSRLGFEEHFGGTVFFLQELCQFFKHRRRIGLAVIDDSNNSCFQGIQARHQRPVFGIQRRSWIQQLEDCHDLIPPREVNNTSACIAHTGRKLFYSPYSLRGLSDKIFSTNRSDRSLLPLTSPTISSRQEVSPCEYSDTTTK